MLWIDVTAKGDDGWTYVAMTAGGLIVRHRGGGPEGAESMVFVPTTEPHVWIAEYRKHKEG